MTTYYDSIFTALNNLITINADDINSTNLNVSNETTMNNAAVKNLTIIDSLFFRLNYMWSNLINQNPLLTGTNHLVSTNFNNNITQSNGSCQLLDTDIGTISQSEESVIIQSGNQWNQLKQTQITDLSITGILTLPPNIVISGALYNDDLIMNNATIQQTAPPSQINTFGATDFYNGDVRMNKNLTMIGGADSLATLKNLYVEGNSNMGLIISPTITDLDSRITTNTNNIVSINNNLPLKADTSYVNTQLNLKTDLTYTNSQLALKANLNNPIFTGTLTASNTNSTNFFTPQSTGGYYFHTVSNGISNPSSRISFSGGNVMFWDNYTPTNIQFRFGVSPITRQTFFNNGDISVGNILNSPTISTINTNIGLKSDKTYVDAQLLLKDNITNVDNKLLLKDNIVDVDAKVLNLQTQINDIIASEYYESISIGTITTLEPDQPAYVINSGTNINAILDFGIPRGYTG
ncbi:MAG: hypothetical protein GY756_04660, partial [bacterium]|nr:hypothetical protein [bacterium]